LPTSEFPFLKATIDKTSVEHLIQARLCS